MILVRPETSPDDVAGMERAGGILTATRRVREPRRRRGARLGKPAVVGAAEVVSATAGSRSASGRSREGDGHLDRRRDGRRVRRAWPRASRGRARGEGAARLGARAGDPRSARRRRRRRTPSVAAAATEAAARTTRCACSRQGLRAGPTPSRRALRCAPDEAQALLDALVADGPRRAGRGSFRLTEAGREPRRTLLADDRETWGDEPRWRRSTRSSTSTSG